MGGSSVEGLGDLNSRQRVEIKMNMVNSWNIYLSVKGFCILFYPKLLSIDIHLHLGGFDKMLTVDKYGVFIN